MNKKLIPHLITILSVILLISCGVVTKTYQQPESSLSEALYRDVNNTDSITMAKKPWQDLFSDQHLQQLIQEGLDQNLDLKSAVERIHIAQATLQQIKLAFYPTLDGTATVTRSGVSGSSATNIWQPYLSSAWELDIWGKLKSTKKAALASYQRSDAACRAIQTALIASIANSYYTLLALDEQLNITRQTIQIREQDVVSMKLLKESGIVTGAAVVQSQANLYSAEVSIPDLQKSIRQTENALCTLLGKAPGSILRGKLAQQVPLTDLKTGISSQLLSNRPDVKEAEFALREAFENVNVAKADFYPTLSLSANSGVSTLSLSNFLDYSLFYNLVAGLTEPIFNRGQIKTSYKIAQARQQEAYNTFKSSLLIAGEEVSNALYAYQMASEKELSRTKQLEALEKSVEFTKELLQYSSATNYTDVLTSEQNLLSAQLASVNDLVEKLQAVVELYRALGGGW